MSSLLFSSVVSVALANFSWVTKDGCFTFFVCLFYAKITETKRLTTIINFVESVPAKRLDETTDLFIASVKQIDVSKG